MALFLMAIMVLPVSAQNFNNEKPMGMMEMHKMMMEEMLGDITVFKAHLSARSEVPANDSTAMGGGVFILDRTNNVLLFFVNYTELEGVRTGAHIHGPAGAGVNAPIMISLPDTKPITGSASVTEAQEAALMSGQTYINVHSDAYPNGEIRGQLKPIDMNMMMQMHMRMMEKMMDKDMMGMHAGMSKDMMSKMMDMDKDQMSKMFDAGMIGGGDKIMSKDMMEKMMDMKKNMMEKMMDGMKM